MSDELAEVKKRIAILERKVEREKRARGMAERQLEDYSREIYQTNLSLQRSLSNAKKRQAELAFLGEASADVSSEISLKDLLENTISLTGQFLEADIGLYIKHGQDGKRVERADFWSRSEKEINKEVMLSEVLKLLPESEPENMPSWLVSEFESHEFNDANWIVFTKFALRGGSAVWIAFISQSEFLDEESLYVLDTARSHLLSGIKRRLNEVRILKRNVALQETVENLEKTKRQLVQSEKMASLGQLAAGVAHEINNPVGFIRSNSEILQDYVCDFKSVIDEVSKALNEKGTLSPSDYGKIIANIDVEYLASDSEEIIQSNLDGLDRVKEIVDNLKSFSHTGDEKFEEMDVVSCLEGALKITNNALKYQHKVEIDIPVGLPLIQGNKGKLQQVFVNLIVNAVQAMEKGGTLRIGFSFNNELIEVSIADTGIGMDEETKNKLFTPFFTTKEVGVGTGLGLSVSYAILESHNVEVSVDSELGKGTCFTLKFPASF